MTAARMVHNATAVRVGDGWHRWHAKCGACGWVESGRSKEGADELAANHNHTANLPTQEMQAVIAFVERMSCDCWIPDLIEYQVELCDRCQLKELLAEAVK